MKISDEMLMAFADGELDLVARAEIEAAMARDPKVAEAIERHRALATRLRSAYDGVLEEPVPKRLASLVADRGAAPVVEIVPVRVTRNVHPSPNAWKLSQWAALAASVVVGLFVGMLLTRLPAPPYEETPAGLVARGELEEALTTQSASFAGDGKVRIGISFRDRAGVYCRTFHMNREAPLAGLACRGGEDWKLEVLATAAPHQVELRPAAAMPMVVLQAVDAAIEGEPLDHAAESAARAAGWREAADMAE